MTTRPRVGRPQIVVDEDDWRLLTDQREGISTFRVLAFKRLHRERLWREHGEAVLRWWIERYPGTRPETWWALEADRPRPATPDAERRYLARHKLLRTHELSIAR